RTFFSFQAEDGIRDFHVTGVQTCALPVSINPGDHAQQTELLLNNRVDLALMLEPAGMKELTFVPLFTDEMKFLVSPVHPWAQARSEERRVGKECRSSTWQYTSKTTQCSGR